MSAKTAYGLGAKMKVPGHRETSTQNYDRLFLSLHNFENEKQN